MQGRMPQTQIFTHTVSAIQQLAGMSVGLGHTCPNPPNLFTPELNTATLVAAFFAARSVPCTFSVLEPFCRKLIAFTDVLLLLGLQASLLAWPRLQPTVLTCILLLTSIFSLVWSVLHQSTNENSMLHNP